MAIQLTKTPTGSYQVDAIINVPTQVTHLFETIEEALEKFKELEIQSVESVTSTDTVVEPGV
jgi:hypothetical protein